MSVFRSRMTMRCTVQRNTSATDEWGQPGAPGWTDHLTELACYATVHSGQEVIGGPQGDTAAQVVVLKDMHVYMPEFASDGSRTDVTEKDRIVSITDRQGNVLFPGPMDIKSVDLRPRRLLDVIVRSAG